LQRKFPVCNDDTRLARRDGPDGHDGAEPDRRTGKHDWSPD